MSEDQLNPYRSPTTITATQDERVHYSIRWFGVAATVTLFSGFISTIKLFPLGAWESWAAGLSFGLLISLSRLCSRCPKRIVYWSLTVLAVLYGCLAVPIATRLSVESIPQFLLWFMGAVLAVAFGEFVAKRLYISRVEK